MNRVDSKFMLPLSFLPELLTHIQGQYRVLDIQGKRLFSYYNQYFDTPELDLYKAHHNGKLIIASTPKALR
ncbi:VTC domain-containing protein (plasmid) [Pseudoalteromonas espejiana]